MSEDAGGPTSYAAKIAKLQQECLTPLKEDLADWLNKILHKESSPNPITTENFMETLENGVIICHLAKLISKWCERQINDVHSTNETTANIAASAGNYEPSPRPRLTRLSNNAYGPSRSTISQSTNCLVSSSTTNLNNGCFYSSHSNVFLNNLIKMHQGKIWEDAKCRTFYARDNVCNFIKWSKEFGVNQSVLFESDDLVLHANPRQVVLCLLDVARIAHVKYGFTDAPGLVKFEQEIDRNLQAERAARQLDFDVQSSQANHSHWPSQSGDNGTKNSLLKRPTSRAKGNFGVSIGDATDELILRYCRHKEAEAARKRQEELKLAEAVAEAAKLDRVESHIVEADSSTNGNNFVDNDDDQLDGKQIYRLINLSCPELDNSFGGREILSTNGTRAHNTAVTTTSPITTTHNHKNLADTGRNDSLDSGEGPTESASTGNGSQSPPPIKYDHDNELTVRSALPVLKKRTNYRPFLTSHKTSSRTNSELSSSRSSLLSNLETSSNNYTSPSFGRRITSDLDGKVMRIAKSYYGKGVTKDVTRLSEGKYKIADRIVFVRLLKGHRVMVRIGGGWDTLENFLFRHKSDPSQVIDVDNLLPLETKVSLNKSSPAPRSSQVFCSISRTQERS